MQTSGGKVTVRVNRVLVLALVFLLTPVASARGGGPGGRPAAPVVVARVETRPAREVRMYTGTLEPKRRARVDSEIAGLVASFPFDLGDPISEGATVAVLRSAIVGHKLAAARADQRALQGVLDALAAGARPEDLARAEARVVEAAARIKQAEWTLSRTRSLFEGGRRVSAGVLQEAETDLAERKAEHTALGAEVALLRAGERPEIIAAAKARVQAAEAFVLQLEEEERQHTVTAPFSGVLVAEHADVGQWLGQGGAVLEMIAVDEVEAVVPVSEDHIAHLEVGSVVRVFVPSVRAAPFTGTLRRVLPVASTRTRAFPVRIRIKNPEVDGRRALLPGMAVNVSLSVGDAGKGLFVPKDAIRLGGRMPEVAVVNPESKQVSIVPVRLGAYEGEWVQVVGEVAPDALIVIEGNERLFPGMPVAFEMPK